MKKNSSNNEMIGRVAGVAGNVLDTGLQILLIVAIVLVISKGAKTAYDYGYRIYTEKPVAASVGKDVEVTIPLDFNALELGKLFESKGLVRDAKLLALQYYASEYREYVKGGTYTLSTTMTAEEKQAYASRFNDLNTYVTEQTLRFVMGESSFDEWDSFIDTVYSMGAEELTTYKQAALDRYNNR